LIIASSLPACRRDTSSRREASDDFTRNYCYCVAGTCRNRMIGAARLSAMTLGSWTAIGLFAAAAALRFTDCSHASWNLLWPSILDDRACLPRNVLLQRFVQRWGDLLQVRYVGNTRVRRYRSPHRCGMRPSNCRRRWRATLSRCLGRTPGQFIFEVARGVRRNSCAHRA